MPGNRPITLVYVENDSALRGLIAGLLRNYSTIDYVADFATGEDAIEYCKHMRPSVALLDVSLGPGVLDGCATGTALRRLNPEIGVVLFSQNSMEAVAGLIDLKGLEAWSYVEKKADMNMDELVSTLVMAARGISSIDQDGFLAVNNSDQAVSKNHLTQRQNLILSLLSSGYEPKYIAERLEISAESVRKDLSVAYSILVPDPKPGSNLRISAILKYQRLSGTVGISGT